MKSSFWIATILAAAVSARAFAGALDPPDDVARLRAAGQYEPALAAALDYEQSLGPAAPEFQRRDARRLVATLRFVLTLDTGTRERLARADSTDLILGGWIMHERFHAALARAVDQLATRADILGPDHAETLSSLHWVARTGSGARDRSLTFVIDDHLLARLPVVLGDDHPALAEAWIRRGGWLRVAGGDLAAMEHWDQGQRIIAPVEAEYAPLAARVLMGKAWHYLYHAGGDPDKAVGLQRQALEVCLAGEERPSEEVAGLATWLAWLLFQSGYRAEAIEYATMVEEECRALGITSHFGLGVVSSLVASNSVIEGDWARAERETRVSAEIADASRDRQLPGYGRVGSPLHQYESLAYCQLELGRFDAAWESLQRSKAAVLTDFMHLARMRRTDPAIGELLDSLRDLDERYKRETAHGCNATALDVLIGKLEVQTAIFDRQRRYLDSHGRREVSIPDIQERLRAGEAYIGWVTTVAGIRQISKVLDSPVFVGAWGYVIRRDRPIAWAPLYESRDPKSVLRRRANFGGLGKLRRAAGWPVRVGDDPELRRSCRDSSRQMFDPLLPYLDGIHTLVIETSEPFFIDSPSEILVLEGDVPLGERFATCNVPSGEAFLMMADRRRPRTAKPSALVVGDPVYSESQLAETAHQDARIEVTQLRQALTGNEEALSRLPRLPRSRVEVERIGEILSSPPLMGAEASEAVLNEMIASGRLAGCNVVHIAAHALMDVDFANSAIALSRLDVTGVPRNNGLVDADEILLTWELNADLVSLSGCQTAYAFRSLTGELVGFTQALVGVGARSVLGSSWKVDDEAAELLMVRFYENYTGVYADERAGRSGEPMGKAESLREARTWLRSYTDASGNRPFVHPVYWAGFVIIGTPD